MRKENRSVTVRRVLKCAFAPGVLQAHKEGLSVLPFVSHSRSHQPSDTVLLAPAPAHTALAFRVGNACCGMLLSLRG